METIQIKEAIIDTKLIPSAVLGVNLSNSEIVQLSQGKEIYLENMNLEDGSVKNGSLRLFLDKQGVVQSSLNFKEEKLEIATEMLGKKLSKEEIERLHKGELVGPIKHLLEQDYFLQVDEKLNRVVVKSSYEVSAIKEVGGYELSKSEQNDFINGVSVGPKVLTGKDGQSFIASFELTPDKKGIVVKDTKLIPADQVAQLKSLYNKKEEPVLQPLDKSSLKPSVELSKTNNKSENQLNLNN